MKELSASALALCLALASVAPSVAGEPSVDDALHSCGKPRGKIAVSFKPGLELRELVDWAMGFSCANFVLSARVGTRGLSVDLITPKRLDRESAWHLFLTALRSMNLTLVRKDEAYEIVEAPQAKVQALPIYGQSERAESGERVVRALIAPEHLEVGELATALAALKSTSGEITPLAGARVLLVTDFASHLARMREVIAAIDRPGQTSDPVWVIPVAHADVDALATTLSAIVGGRDKPAKGSKGAEPVQILADERTRSLILIAARPVYRRVRALIRRLDVDVGEGGDGHIHMIGLEHADAEATAQTLTALLGGRGPATRNKKGSKNSSEAVAVTGDVRVTHDAPTNSLLVMASMRDFVGISEIVRRLDTRRRQVYIEAMILEISVGNQRKLGSSFHLGGDRDGGVWISGLQHEDLRSASVDGLASATGLLGALFGQPLVAELLGQTVPSFGVLFQVLATGRHANLVSSPRVTTSDNTEAVFRVAESRRELGAIQTVGTGATQQAVETVDANLTLKVTPHVNATDQVRLEIELLIEEFLPSSRGSLGSDKTSREIRNTVVVRDRESVVLGGLLLDRVVDTESKLPLFGDLPVLGHLFKSSTKEVDKQNLVILLTPHVLDGTADQHEIVRRNLAERAEFLRAHGGLAGAEYRPAVDYRRKRGLLEAINQSVQAIEADKKALEAIEAPASETAEGPY